VLRRIAARRHDGLEPDQHERPEHRVVDVRGVHDRLEHRHERADVIVRSVE
jgi:hypothetical protein